MKIPDLIFVGTTTMDIVHGKRQLGGSAYYGAKTAQKLGQKIGIWTNNDPKIGKLKIFEGIEIFISNPNCMTFEHQYNEETGERIVRCTELTGALDSKTLPEKWRGANGVIFCPNGHDVIPEHFQLFTSCFSMFLPQGWFRRFHPDGHVTFDTLIYPQISKKFDLLVVSQEDLIGDLNAWDQLKKMAKVSVQTLGKKGHIVFEEGKETLLKPPFVAKEIDPTGAGDIFATTMFISMMNGVLPIDAAQVGSVAASYAVEKEGIEGLPTTKQIQERLQKIRF